MEGSEGRPRPAMASEVPTGAHGRVEAEVLTSEQMSSAVSDQGRASVGVGDNAAFASEVIPSEGIPARYPVDPDRSGVMDQVIRHVTTSMQRGRSEMQVRLQPEEWGTVRLRLVMEDGALTARLQVEDETVKAMMESHLPRLHAALEERGIQVQTFEVSTEPEWSDAPHRENEEAPRGRSFNAFDRMPKNGQENMGYPDKYERHGRRQFGYNTMEMTA